MTDTTTPTAEATDWAALSAELEQTLRLRSIPFAMKMFELREDMEAIPRIRRPSAVHTLDQVVGQASRLGWTVGVTAEDLVGAQCRAVVGLGGAKTDDWRSGRHMKGVWFEDDAGAAAHQAAMHCVPDGQFEALAVSPLASGRLGEPDIALFYATPGAMMYFINGLQWSGYKRFDWSVVFPPIRFRSACRCRAGPSCWISRHHWLRKARCWWRHPVARRCRKVP